MRVLTAEEMRRCDATAIEGFGIPGTVLMETAGRAVARKALELVGEAAGRRAAVLCGGGNNGGDGFVVARYLLGAGLEVDVVSAKAKDDLKGDPQVFFGVLERLGARVHYVTTDDAPIPELPLGPGDLVVDALLGTGLDRDVGGRLARLVAQANAWGRAGANVVAVDVPSGLAADTGQILGTCVKADATVTFGYLKRGLLLHPGADYVGDWEVADIGLPPQVEDALGPACRLLDEAGVRAFAPRRPPDAHKGTVGHVLVVAGSPDKPGAAALTCLGALRSGAGLVTLASRDGGHVVVRAQLPEVMGLTLPGDGALGLSDLPAILEAAEGKDVVAFGPGIPRGDQTGELIGRLLVELDVPVVLDADGLNALVGRTDLLKGSAVDVVLTPHPGEMARLIGGSIRDVQSDRLGVAAAFAKAHDATLLLKGASTVVADPDGALAINPTGNPGMATGGSGDLLTGLLAALLGQGLSPGAAARLGAYVHGLAGDRVAARRGQAGLAASDLAEGLCEVWRAWDL